MNSCQDSIPETIEEEEVAQLNDNTNLSNLLSRTALNDGSMDNIIDRANNITVVLPITVIVNGIEISVTTKNDFQLIENAIEAFTDDDDIVNIVFPIDIVLTDYTQITVSNQTEFDEFVSESTDENEFDDDIECIDFIFPITFEALEVNAAIPTTITVTDDAELFELTDSLEDYASITINFPIALITFDGVEITANDLEELESTIENNIDVCDEDDDFDFNDDDEGVLFDFLTDGNWIIDEYATDEEDFTEDYNGYVFNFDSNFDANANDGTTNVPGTWAIDNTDPENLLLTLDFGTAVPFDVLNDSWRITESEIGGLALEIGSEANGDLRVLVFEKL
ncbi:MAG: hypothetical protein ABNH19_12995 [Dokdonia sp.]|jgi:hypothetical protein